MTAAGAVVTFVVVWWLIFFMALPFGAQVYRTDAVELDHIHEVVMELVELAQAQGGDYDGWECGVVRDS